MSGDPPRALVLSYAPAHERSGFEALLALDDALALLLRTTREPALGQLRLAWWRESLEKLDHQPAPAEPVLAALQQNVVAAGISGRSLVPIVHGWEVLVEEERLDEDALTRFAHGRGSLFQVSSEVLGGARGEWLMQAGRGWALANLATNLTNTEEAQTARTLALPLLHGAAKRRWQRELRALGAMTHLALMDMEDRISPGSRIARLLWHRLSGL